MTRPTLRLSAPLTGAKSAGVAGAPAARGLDGAGRFRTAWRVGAARRVRLFRFGLRVDFFAGVFAMSASLSGKVRLPTVEWGC
jgi:hypothetical protein